MKVVLESITRRNVWIFQFSENCCGISLALQFDRVRLYNGTLNQDFVSYLSMQASTKPSFLYTPSD
jgi:hypothetical protein